MAITFGGLATGMDTNAIVSELMNIERKPVTRLEQDKTFFNNRLSAFTKLDGLLQALQTKAEGIDTAAEIDSPGLKQSSDTYFSATATDTTGIGSYQIAVTSLALPQKDASAGYADKASSSFGTGVMTLTVDGTPTDITIDSSNNSLQGIADAINATDLGVTATIINDGTASPYRLVLSGDNAARSFSLDASALSGGTDANPAMATVQTSAMAQIKVDGGITISSDSNTIADAIPGVTLELLKADTTATPETTTLDISADQSATKTKIQGFVGAYNAIVKHIAGQSTADWGNDSSFRAVKRGLQDLLTTSIPGLGGSVSNLAELGFETQKDGTITLNADTLDKAIEADYDGVVAVFAGKDGIDGISTKFADYMANLTDSSSGLLFSKKKSTEATVKRIDAQIERLSARLVSREKTLRSQFSAMEELVSGLNNQSSFLTQQLANIANMNNNKN